MVKHPHYQHGEEEPQKGECSLSGRWFARMNTVRNEIAHDYLIESSDRVLTEAYRRSSVLLETVEKIGAYILSKGYIS